MLVCLSLCVSVMPVCLCRPASSSVTSLPSQSTDVVQKTSGSVSRLVNMHANTHCVSMHYGFRWFDPDVIEQVVVSSKLELWQSNRCAAPTPAASIELMTMVKISLTLTFDLFTSRSVHTEFLL